MSDSTMHVDVLVAGGGLAGLTAAVVAARSGCSTALLERSSAAGGRAATREEAGCLFNLGAHALYRKGAAARFLDELGVEYSGGVPLASGAWAITSEGRHTLPTGFVSLLTTRLLGLAGKLEVARLLASLQRLDAASYHDTSVRRWLEETLRDPVARELLRALVRLTTYTDDPDRMSAGAAIGQLQMALESNVLYVDGGWQTLVNGLQDAAQQAGVRVQTGARVVQMQRDGDRLVLAGADGRRWSAGAVILALPPSAAAEVGREFAPALDRWAANAVPVRAACLDLGLAHLPRPRATFALGIDRPLYLSVHSAAARLAPPGRSTVQLIRYLGANDGDPGRDRSELEGLLDVVQPGWREVIVADSFLPRMTVAHALPTAAGGGLAGRPGPDVPNAAGLYVAGDWVGDEGLLADAAMASAAEAARRAARFARLRGEAVAA